MAFVYETIATPANAVTGIGAIQSGTPASDPSFATEQAFITRVIAFIQTEINNMGAPNQLQLRVSGSHGEKQCRLYLVLDKATPVFVTNQLVHILEQAGLN